MKRNAAIVLLSAALLLVLAKSNFIAKVKARSGLEADCSQCAVLAEADKLAPSNSVVFLGDSQIARMQTDFIASPSLNYGISGETLPQLAARIGDYHSISNARAVVIHSGINDAVRGLPVAGSIAAMIRILAAIPTNTPVVVSLVLPTSKAAPDKIAALNDALQKLPRVRIANASTLPSTSLVSDGLHLNASGMATLGNKIREQLH